VGQKSSDVGVYICHNYWILMWQLFVKCGGIH